MRPCLCALVAALVATCPSAALAADPGPWRTLDGSLNNKEHPQWGKAGTAYPRRTAANYADRRGKAVTGPSPRYVSNRIFSDTSQNLFSENGVTQWGAVWGQFLDHTFGLRQESGGERQPLAYDAADPLEAFRNDFGSIDFERTPAAAGTGTSSTRQQLNTVGGYIDASSVYGDSAERLEWLRQYGDEGDSARLFLPGGYLPRADARGDAAHAPAMALVGRLMLHPSRAMVAGDLRANENVSLTATHTLFAREHNRIVDKLPDSLSDEERFQIARRVVGAEQQYITYEEFLPALGVELSDYDGYDPDVNASITNEFAVVGFRAHSMVHGELEPSAPEGTYSDEELEAFEAQGIEVEHEDGVVVLVVPLNLAFANPDLLERIGVGPVLKGIGGEPQYKNDEQIDNQLRSVLFQIPRPGAPNPAGCLEGPTLPDCFAGVVDLAALDIERGRDHGMPTYTALARAYGLTPKTNFVGITGESSASFARDPEVDASRPIDDPDILDFMSLRDRSGDELPLDSPDAQAVAVSGERRTPVAARLRAIYGSVDKLDAFVGMSAEKHLEDSEFGPLQHEMWKEQFEALRDGDRFFYRCDDRLKDIAKRYGLTYKHTLGEIIELNTDEDVARDVFTIPA